MPSTIARIKHSNEGRLPEMLSIKYRYMTENMFRFYRGSCSIFYEDLVHQKLPFTPVTWISGDLHLENFGSFKGDNRVVYFDLNDFDEAVLAPAGYELVRLLTSIYIGFESLKLGRNKAIHLSKLFLKSYSNTLASGKPDYVEPQTASGIVREFLKKVKKRKQNKILRKRTVFDKDELRLQDSHPKHLPLDEQLKKDLTRHFNDWLRHDGRSPYNYEVADVAFRLAGTGSIGLKRYAFLLRSVNETGEKYMLVDMKQAWPSSLQPFVKSKQPQWLNDAERITAIQRIMQNRSPALLSTTTFNGDTFVIQEMQSQKDDIDFRLLKQDYRAMCDVIGTMGMLTASSQLRSCGRFGAANADELIAFGKDCLWHEALLQYALDYSGVVKRNYGEFKKAWREGKFKTH